MLNHHFYQSNDAENLQKFFAKSKRLAIVCDPPFGALISALEKSLNKLKQLFIGTAKGGAELGTVLFLPVFIGNQLKGMSIVDYKVFSLRFYCFIRPFRSPIPIIRSTSTATRQWSEFS